MTKYEEILEFINRRWQGDSDWLTGNCWYFVSILIERFPHLKRYYAPVEGHFVAGDGKHYYDWCGEYITEQTLVSWEEIYKNDPVWADRLRKYCQK